MSKSNAANVLNTRIMENITNKIRCYFLIKNLIKMMFEIPEMIEKNLLGNA